MDSSHRITLHIIFLIFISCGFTFIAQAAENGMMSANQTGTPTYKINSLKASMKTILEENFIVLSVNANFNNCKGKKVSLFGFPQEKTADGTWQYVKQYTDFSQVNKNGNIWMQSGYFNCSYDNSTWDDVEVKIPSRRFSHPREKISYRIKLSSDMPDGTTLAYDPSSQNDYFYFNIEWDTSNPCPTEDMTARELYKKYRYYKSKTEGEYDKYYADEWLMSAARRGDPDAINMLAYYYVVGDKVMVSGISPDEYPFAIKPDVEKAEFWYKKARANGSAEAKKFLDLIDSYKALLNKKILEPSQLKDIYYIYKHEYFGVKNISIGLSCLELAAGKGDKEAKEMLGNAYANIAEYYCQKMDFNNAVYWGNKTISYTGDYSLTADLGDRMSKRGYIDYAFKNYDSAYKEFYVGAQFGSGAATANLAKCYFNGKGVEKDIDKAYALIKSAKRLGYDDPDDYMGTIGAEINRQNYQRYEAQQRRAEEEYQRKRNQQLIGGAVAVGVVVAGVAALCSGIKNAFSSSSSSTYSSSSSSSSTYSSSSSSYSSTTTSAPTNQYDTGSVVVRSSIVMQENEFPYREGKFELKNGAKGEFREYSSGWTGSVDPGATWGNVKDCQSFEDLLRRLEQKNFEFWKFFYDKNGYLPSHLKIY